MSATGFASYSLMSATISLERIIAPSAARSSMSNEVNVDGPLDPRSGDEAPQLPLVAPAADYDQPRMRRHLEEGRHRRNEPVMTFVALQRPTELMSGEPVATVWASSRRGEARRRSVSAGFSGDQSPVGGRTPRPQMRRRRRGHSTGEGGPHRPPLRLPNHGPKSTRVASSVEAHHGRDPGSLRGSERHGGQERVEALHMHEVVASSGDLP